MVVEGRKKPYTMGVMSILRTYVEIMVVMACKSHHRGNHLAAGINLFIRTSYHGHNVQNPLGENIDNYLDANA